MKESTKCKNLTKMILRSGNFYRTPIRKKVGKKKDKQSNSKNELLSLSIVKKLFINNHEIANIKSNCGICYFSYNTNSLMVSCKNEKIKFHNFHPECLLEYIDYNKYSDQLYYSLKYNKLEYIPNTVFFCPYCLDKININYNCLKNIIYT